MSRVCRQCGVGVNGKPDAPPRPKRNALQWDSCHSQKGGLVYTQLFSPEQLRMPHFMR